MVLDPLAVIRDLSALLAPGAREALLLSFLNRQDDTCSLTVVKASDGNFCTEWLLELEC